jgi:hypothetical protein
MKVLKTCAQMRWSIFTHDGGLKRCMEVLKSEGIL